MRHRCKARRRVSPHGHDAVAGTCRNRRAITRWKRGGVVAQDCVNFPLGVNSRSRPLLLLLHLALHLACETGHLDIANLLLASGAD